MPDFWKVVNQVINDADILLLILDARLIPETRNIEIEHKVKRLNKPLIYVITKCDLVKDKKTLEQSKKTLDPSVFVSAKEHLGTSLLREKIFIEAKKAKLHSHNIHVGVLGYPNVGKSSLINALKGKRSAKTSILSGYTKGLQKLRAGKIILLDTPGVIPYHEKDFLKHASIGTMDFTQVKEPDIVVMHLMERFPGKIEKHYQVKILEDKEETIENIARKQNIMKKGGQPDLMRMATEILKDWQKGAIK